MLPTGVDARALHRALAVKAEFLDWIKAHIAYDNYQENQDFILRQPPIQNHRLDYFVSLDMAKGIAISEAVSPTRTEVRKLLLDAERKTVINLIGTHRPTFDRQIDEIVDARLSYLVKTSLPILLTELFADKRLQFRYRKTAGQIWRDKGFPPIRSRNWFGNQLERAGCRVDGATRGELGHSISRLFDPDKVDRWLAAGGKQIVKLKIAEAMGQGHFRFVFPQMDRPTPPPPGATAGSGARRSRRSGKSDSRP